MPVTCCEVTRGDAQCGAQSALLRVSHSLPRCKPALAATLRARSPLGEVTASTTGVTAGHFCPPLAPCQTRLPLGWMCLSRNSFSSAVSTDLFGVHIACIHPVTVTLRLLCLLTPPPISLDSLSTSPDSISLCPVIHLLFFSLNSLNFWVPHVKKTMQHVSSVPDLFPLALEIQDVFIVLQMT